MCLLIARNLVYFLSLLNKISDSLFGILFAILVKGAKGGNGCYLPNVLGTGLKNGATNLAFKNLLFIINEAVPKNMLYNN